MLCVKPEVSPATGPKSALPGYNKDGKGFNLKLTLMPVGEADIVVREFQAEGDAE